MSWVDWGARHQESHQRALYGFIDQSPTTTSPIYFERKRSDIGKNYQYI